MNHKKNLLALFLLAFAASGSCSSQMQRPATPDTRLPYGQIQIQGVLREGLNLIFEIDSAVIGWGIDTQHLIKQGELAVENAGWRFNPSSQNHYLIRIDTVRPSRTGINTVRIELFHSLDEFPARQTVELPTDEMLIISSVVYQMVSKTAIKNRNRLLKEMSKKHDPEHFPSSEQLYRGDR